MDSLLTGVELERRREYVDRSKVRKRKTTYGQLI